MRCRARPASLQRTGAVCVLNERRPLPQREIPSPQNAPIRPRRSTTDVRGEATSCSTVPAALPALCRNFLYSFTVGTFGVDQFIRKEAAEANQCIGSVVHERGIVISDSTEPCQRVLGSFERNAWFPSLAEPAEPSGAAVCPYLKSTVVLLRCLRSSLALSLKRRFCLCQSQAFLRQPAGGRSPPAAFKVRFVERCRTSAESCRSDDVALAGEPSSVLMTSK